MKYLLTTIVLSILLPTVSFADTNEAVIINNVSASSHTGGNSAEAGQVVNGEARTELRVYTEINGEVVEDLHEVKVEGDGEAKVEYKKTHVISNEEGESVSEVEHLEQEEIKQTEISIKDKLNILRKILNHVFSIFIF